MTSYLDAVEEITRRPGEWSWHFFDDEPRVLMMMSAPRSRVALRALAEWSAGGNGFEWTLAALSGEVVT